MIYNIDSIVKIVTGQKNGYTTGCFLDYPFFKYFYHIATTST